MGLRVILYDPDQRGNQFPLWAELATLSTFSSVDPPSSRDLPSRPSRAPLPSGSPPTSQSSLRMRFPFPVSSWQCTDPSRACLRWPRPLPPAFSPQSPLNLLSHVCIMGCPMPPHASSRLDCKVLKTTGIHPSCGS